jgi:hypothetical protein|tara:strand:- start:293 stop:499 length:207 start_codon:yes stop_codon:yes gene_type:complete
MPENFKKDDVSEKRKKYIENLKTRPTEKHTGFWNSRPLGFGMRAWRIFFTVVLIIAVWQIISLVILND